NRLKACSKNLFRAAAEVTRLIPEPPHGGCFFFNGMLSTPFHKYEHVCCVDFRFWRGATREHPPQRGCDRGATKPEPKRDTTLRAAVLFGPDVVAHSLQTPEGYARVPVRKHFAPRLGQKSLSA